MAVQSASTDFLLKVDSDSQACHFFRDFSFERKTTCLAEVRAQVSHLILDAGDKLVGQGCCTSVLSIIGNNSVISDVEVLNTSIGGP